MNGPVDKESFIKAMRSWATGVTVVTARDGERVHGMTASSFTSVSAEPPLVLICANRDTRTAELISAARSFAVNILAVDQQGLSNRFAWGDAAKRFDDLDCRDGELGAPLLAGTLGAFECRLRSAHHEGTHTIYVGEVVATHAGADKEPLLYYSGDYREIGKVLPKEG